MSPAPLTAETMIDGRYALLERLTDFGLGEVWKAQDSKFRDRFVAVKFLRPLEGAPTKLPDALLAHFRTVREIRHPSVLPIVNQGIHDGRPFVVHEFFEGASLGTRLDEARASGNALRLGVVAAIFDGFCAALGVVHARRPPLVHDALSPASVLVGPLPTEGDAVETRLIDIGLGPWCEPFDAPRQSARSVRCQAPEQLSGAARTPATDVFGFGLVALETLADLPDADASLTAVRGYQGRTDVPDAVWALLLDATRDSVEARPADGNALRSALTEGWKGPVTVAGAPPSSSGSTATSAAPEGPAAADADAAPSDEPAAARPVAPPSLDVTAPAAASALEPEPAPLVLPALAPLALPALPALPVVTSARAAAPPTPEAVEDDEEEEEEGLGLSRTIMRPAPSEADPDDDASATSVDLSKQVSSALGQSVGETRDLGDDVAALLGSQGSSATVDVSEAAAAVLGEMDAPEIGGRTVMRDDAMLAFTAKLNELAATRQRAANQGPVLAGGVYALPALPQSPAAPAEPLPLPAVRSTPPAAAVETPAVAHPAGATVDAGEANGLPGWAWALAAFIVAAGAATAWLVLRS